MELPKLWSRTGSRRLPVRSRDQTAMKERKAVSAIVRASNENCP